MAASGRRRWRGIGARSLTVLGVLLLLVSIAANFVERQALDNDEFEETAEQLVSDPEIQERVALVMTDQLFANVDVEAALRARLPENQSALAGPLAGALRPVAERVARELLERPRFQTLWVQAAGAAQQQVVRLLDDEARFLETEQGVVAIDLRPLLVELTDQLRIAPNLSERVPEDAGLVTLFDAEQLEAAQDLTRVLRLVAAWIWVLALAAWVAAVYLASDRRKEIRAIAAGVIVLGVLVLALRRFAGDYVVDRLTEPPADDDAAQRTWDILTRLLADAGWAAIGVGVVALLGAWLVGPGSAAARARIFLAPHLRNAWLTYGVAAFLFLVLLVWGPISYVQRPLPILAFAVLAAAGVEVLRRTAVREAAMDTRPPPS